MTQHLYFIEAGVGGPVKVGRAKDVEKRLSDLQQGCPVPLRILAVVHEGGHDEQRIHRELGPSHVRGEWFERPSVDEFLGYLHQARLERQATA